jgi:hypothetical protein
MDSKYRLSIALRHEFRAIALILYQPLFARLTHFHPVITDLAIAAMALMPAIEWSTRSDGKQCVVFGRSIREFPRRVGGGLGADGVEASTAVAALGRWTPG